MMRTSVSRLCGLCCLLVAWTASADWSMPMEAGRWELVSQPPSISLPGAASHLEGRPVASASGVNATPAAKVAAIEGAVTFAVGGDAPNLRSASWKLKIEGSQQPVGYISLRYRAGGVDRGYTKVNLLVVEGTDASGKSVSVPAVIDTQIINDRRWHVLTVKLSAAVTPSQLTLQLGTTDSAAELSIAELLLHSAASKSLNGYEREHDWKQNKLSKENFQIIDLTGRLNASADDHFLSVLENKSALSDAGLSFRDTYVCVEGIPLHLGDPDRNLFWPAETRTNVGKIQFFGELVDRASLMPEMRADTIPLDVGRKASELYLLLATDFPVTTARYGLPDAPYEINDVDAFRVELIYEDGGRDIVFPYSVADGGFTVRRMCGTYAVPCDPSRVLQRAVIHNCITGKTVGLMAATANIGEARLFPQLAEDERNSPVPALAAPAASNAAVQYQNKRLTLQNQFYDVTIDCSNGFAIQKLAHRSSKSPVALSATSGIEVRIGDQLFDGTAFETKDVKVNGKTAVIQLAGKDAKRPVAMEVRMDTSDPQQLLFGATITNSGKEELKASVTFPHLKELSLGDAKDNWLYFPQYRAVLTNQTGFFRAPNDRSFAVQFFDFFTPSAGYGLAVITHNHEGLPLDYLAAKNEQGLTGGIVYPETYWPIDAGASRKLPDTALVFHNGDWHDALRLYKDWLATVNPQIDRKPRNWFKDVWLFRSQVISDPEARGINRAPGILDRKAGKYRIDESFDLDEIYYGMLPHAYHFYNWFYDEKLGEEVWGDYSTDSYNNGGGLALIRSTIEDLQNKRKIPASLYLISDRCSKASDFGRKYGEKIVACGPDGAITQDGKAYYVCPAVPLWRDHIVDTFVRVQKETGAKILYLDVFAYYRGHSCFAKDHGHPVPMAINQSSKDLLQRLRDRLPADVVLYSEYPCTDTSAYLNDGNLQYYNLSLEEHFVRSHDLGDAAPMCGKPVQSVDRFAFPWLRQFSFVVGLDGDDNKGTRIKPVFFNGEGILDPTWRLYPGVHGDFLRKSLRLRVKYTDCFSTLTPEPLVPTIRKGVYANRFPGEGREMYTLHNTRFTPVRGEVIELPHAEGDSYYDAYNGQTLVPVMRDGKAIVSLELQPQSVGCVLRRLGKPAK